MKNIEFNELDSLSAGDLNDLVSTEVDYPDDPKVKKLFNKGKIWRIWKKIHKDCQNNMLSTSPIYLGVSNSLGIGTVIRFDTNNKKISAEYPFHTNKLTEEELKLVLKSGNPSSCQVARKVNVSLEFGAQANIFSGLDPELETEIKNNKEITACIDSWQVNELFYSAWGSILSRRNEPYFQDYLKACAKPNAFVITREYEVRGFTTTINTKTDLKGNVKAKLSQGIIKNLGETGARVNFSVSGEQSIKAVTQGSFIVFCDVMAARELGS